MKDSLIKRLENQLFLVSILLATCIIILGMTFLNDVVKHIRLDELKAYLRMINREESNIDYLGMVSKYKLHKELYENKITVQQLDKIELRTSYLLSSYERKSDPTTRKYELVTGPVLTVINFLRFFLQKQPLQSVINEAGNDEIAVAYYYEKNKEYSNALAIYDEILKYNKVDEKKKPTIYLHQAFCYSIIGSHQRAEEILLRIIKEYDNEQIAIAAAILLQHIRDFRSEIQKVKESTADSLEKSEKLFKLIAFNDALTVLNEVKTEDAEQEEKIKYLQARCYEETGKKEKSVELYQTIITENIEAGNYQDEYSKLANQRIYVMSTMDSENLGKLETLAEVNNKLIQDENFDELKETTTSFESFQSQNKVVEQKIRAFESSLDATEPVSLSEPSPSAQIRSSIAVLNPETTAGVQTTGKPVTDEEANAQALQKGEMAKLLDKFINQSIEHVTKKVEEIELNPERLKPLPETTEPPRPSLLPALTIKPTRKPTSKPVQTSRPTQPPTKAPQEIDGKEPYTKAYTDAKGQVFKVESYDEHDVLQNYYIYEYDSEGNPVRVLNYDAAGNLIEDF